MATPGWSSKDEADLCECVRTRFRRLRELVGSSGVRLTIIETMRDAVRQTHYVKIGASRTLNSKHLPAPPHHRSLAVDVCPTAYLAERNWNPTGDAWTLIGNTAFIVGLEWGGAWKTFKDRPHLQLKRCLCGEEKGGSEAGKK